ncbi:MAG: NYN domain-containing protein [Rhodobacteraceae bacterium]|nr:NYN domain-containing protein [Paracoccaceae bacterium]
MLPVFFDVQNLFRHAKDAFGHHHPNFDPVKLHEAVCEPRGWVAHAVRFYTGVPDLRRAPAQNSMTQHTAAFWKKQEMWAGYRSSRLLSLKRQGVCVIKRNLTYQFREKNIPVPKEKGIDVRLALDIVRHARRREFDAAVIYSQDQDLCEVARAVRESGRGSGARHRGLRCRARWFKSARGYARHRLD